MAGRSASRKSKAPVQTRRRASSSPKGSRPTPIAIRTRTQSRPEWDVFVAHASGDKESLVRPLASFLRTQGLRVWYDEFELVVGDSISEAVDRGLARSKYGIVILSPNFTSRAWPKHELRGLVTVALSGQGGGRILPVWHRLTHEQVVEFSPTLADLWALKSDGSDVITLGLRILQIVRPELYSQLRRRALFDRLVSEARPQMARVRDLSPGPIKH